MTGITMRLVTLTLFLLSIAGPAFPQADSDFWSRQREWEKPGSEWDQWYQQRENDARRREREEFERRQNELERRQDELERRQQEEQDWRDW